MAKKSVISTISIVLLAAVLSHGAHGQKIELSDIIKTDLAVKWAYQELKMDKYSRPESVVSQELPGTPASLFYQINLVDKKLGTTSLTVRQPKNMKGKLPLVFVAAGIHSDFNTIRAFEESPNYILAVYHYPVRMQDKPFHLAQTALQRLPQIYGQLAMSLKWLSETPEVISERVNVVLVSFSTFVGPLSLKLAEPLLSAPIFSTVFAYGGADIKNFVLPQLQKHLTDVEFKQIERPVSKIVDVFDPKHHLKDIKGHVMVIQTEKDEMIPVASRQALVTAIKVPKNIITLKDVPHINIDRPQVITLTMREVEKWYTSIGAFK